MEKKETRSLVPAAIGVGAAAAAAAGAGYAVLRSRKRAKLGGELPEDLYLPSGVRHLDIPVRDGGSIHVVDWGEGAPILFLHGVTLSSEIWSYQFHDLGPSQRTIAVDLRGHGASQPGEEQMTIAAMADDVADVLEALDLRQVTLVGHSMGGMTLLRFARRHPDLLRARVGATVIVASAGGISPPLSAWHNFAPQAAALAVAGHKVFNRSGRPLLPGSTAGERAARVIFGLQPDQAAVRRTVDIVRAMHPDNLVALLPELVGFDERAAFEDLGVPTVVVVGDRDRLTPPRYAEALAETLPGSRLLLWPGAGHMLMYERRRQLDELIVDMSRAARRVIASNGH